MFCSKFNFSGDEKFWSDGNVQFSLCAVSWKGSFVRTLQGSCECEIVVRLGDVKEIVYSSLSSSEVSRLLVFFLKEGTLEKLRISSGVESGCWSGWHGGSLF